MGREIKGYRLARVLRARVYACSLLILTSLSALPEVSAMMPEPEPICSLEAGGIIGGLLDGIKKGILDALNQEDMKFCVSNNVNNDKAGEVDAHGASSLAEFMAHDDVKEECESLGTGVTNVCSAAEDCLAKFEEEATKRLLEAIKAFKDHPIIELCGEEFFKGLVEGIIGELRDGVKDLFDQAQKKVCEFICNKAIPGSGFGPKAGRAVCNASCSGIKDCQKAGNAAANACKIVAPRIDLDPLMMPHFENRGVQVQ